VDNHRSSPSGRIAGVKTHLVHCPIPEQFRVRSGAGLKLARQAAFVEITTDQGLTGIGPCSFGSASLDLHAAASMLDHAIAPMLLGEDAGRISYLWDKVYYGSITRVLGPRGIGVALLSGVDIALWDIKGKAAGLPLYELLGGVFHSPVKAYASSIYWLPPEEAAAQARAYVDEGFGAVKMKVGLNYRNDVASLEAIRDAVGPNVDIMVDANQCYSRHLALQVGKELEKYNVLFFEEPLPTDDVEGHAFLAERLSTRIATGENMYTRWEFLPFVEKRAIHVLQGDASRTGGITEAKRIFELAAAHHLYAAPHTFSDVLTVAASLHLNAVSPNAILLELDRTYNPLMTEMVTQPLHVHDGVVELPTGPGLGLEIDWDFIHEHPYGGEHGIGAGARPAFGLANELLPDRTVEALR
jgi:L-alanine-DL-glutamate epimerase-like enolase superfamily enzyme